MSYHGLSGGGHHGGHQGGGWGGGHHHHHGGGFRRGWGGGWGGWAYPWPDYGYSTEYVEVEPVYRVSCDNYDVDVRGLKNAVHRAMAFVQGPRTLCLVSDESGRPVASVSWKDGAPSVQMI